MQHRLGYRLVFILTALLGFGLLALTPGCDDDDVPPKYQDSAVDQKVSKDTTPDTGKDPDNGLWPDKGASDLWPSDDKGYGGGMFGCKTDADCFGQKCCPTPWGVKLCAPACAGQ